MNKELSKDFLRSYHPYIKKEANRKDASQLEGNQLRGMILQFRNMLGNKISQGNTPEEQRRMKKIEKKIVFQIAELDGEDFEQMRDLFTLAIKQVVFVHALQGRKGEGKEN